ncbi:MAG TPA: hypothetical protein VHU83_05935 [Bryobacteraceae bacterium]|jgi:hypothetical protein|nr:hypothetical protein [Bryobacteraceae bacterium]
MRRSYLVLFGSLLIVAPPALSQLATSQYNNQRTGANLAETKLTPANVNSRDFGKLFSLKVDGDVYAQPLVVPRLEIPGQGKHDVVFVATEHDSVYAFDADKKAPPLWRVSFLDAAKAVAAIPAQHLRCPFINPEVGITSTPVIDLEQRTLFVLARTMEQASDPQSKYVQRLHALDVTTGKERPGSPVEIKAAVTAEDRAHKPHEIVFDPLVENPRAALLLVNGTVYLTWASSCDVGDYHGWVMAYDARSLQQKAVFITSPNGKEGGIWQSDAGPAADSSGNVYVVTGNGDFDESAGNYGDSMLKLALDRDKLLVRDYFTPHDQAMLSSKDLDLGSGGPVLLPDRNGPHPHLAVTGGKDGNLFLIDRDHMGKFHAGMDEVIQTVKLKGRLHAASAYWNRHVYVFGDGDVLHDLKLTGGKLSREHHASGAPTDPGATPTVSANGDRDGIVWTISTRTWEVFPERLAVLHAYDAADVARELYNSSENPDRDQAGISVRFTIPSVVAGRVYVAARSEVDVYGLLH